MVLPMVRPNVRHQAKYHVWTCGLSEPYTLYTILISKVRIVHEHELKFQWSMKEPQESVKVVKTLLEKKCFPWQKLLLVPFFTLD